MARWDGEELHDRLCRALDIQRGHGSKARVAAWLGDLFGITDTRSRNTRYAQIRADQQTSLEALWRLCREAGIRVTLETDGTAWFG